MNELSERDVEVFEHIRDTYAELDPVPEDVLAAARRALGLGLPTLPFGVATSRPCVGQSGSPDRPLTAGPIYRGRGQGSSGSSSYGI